MVNALKQLLSYFYPAFCVSCRVIINGCDALCISCFASLPRASVLRITLPKGTALAVHAVTHYEGVGAFLVAAKEGRNQEGARTLGRLLAQYVKAHALVYDVIVPVPLHWVRFLWRGYNQAALMARALVSEGAYISRSFCRMKKTKDQKHLSGAARRRNVAHAFGTGWFVSAHRVRQDIAGKHVLIVDDVYTTGSTVRELAAVIERFKPASITVLLGCRVLR